MHLHQLTESNDTLSEGVLRTTKRIHAMDEPVYYSKYQRLLLADSSFSRTIYYNEVACSVIQRDQRRRCISDSSVCSGEELQSKSVTDSPIIAASSKYHMLDEWNISHLMRLRNTIKTLFSDIEAPREVYESDSCLEPNGPPPMLSIRLSQA